MGTGSRQLRGSACRAVDPLAAPRLAPPPPVGPAPALCVEAAARLGTWVAYLSALADEGRRATARPGPCCRAPWLTRTRLLAAAAAAEAADGGSRAAALLGAAPCLWGPPLRPQCAPAPRCWPAWGEVAAAAAAAGLPARSSNLCLGLPLALGAARGGWGSRFRGPLARPAALLQSLLAAAGGGGADLAAEGRCGPAIRWPACEPGGCSKYAPAAEGGGGRRAPLAAADGGHLASLANTVLARQARGAWRGRGGEGRRELLLLLVCLTACVRAP